MALSLKRKSEVEEAEVGSKGGWVGEGVPDMDLILEDDDVLGLDLSDLPPLKYSNITDDELSDLWPLNYWKAVIYLFLEHLDNVLCNS